MRKSRVIGLLSLLCGLVSALPHPLRAESYEVLGEIVYTPQPTNPNAQHSTNSFRVVVDGEKWLIRNTPKPFKGIQFQEVAFDGKELRQVTQFDPVTKTESMNQAVGLIEFGSVPAAEPPMQVGPVWLALASSSYLRSRTNDLLTPIWPLHVGVRETGHQVRAEWELSAPAPKLPKKVRYFSDGKNYSIKNGVLRGTPASAPYDQGYLSAHFTVDGITNVSGLTFPTGFTFERFAPKRDGTSRDDVYPNARVVGKILSISAGTKETDFLPALISSTWVVDRRIPGMMPASKIIDYIVKDNVWPKTNAPSVSQAVKK